MVASLGDRLRAAYGPGHVVREEKPIELADSLPEPDVAVVRSSHADFTARHPRATDVTLAVEVAVTSQAVNRDKVPVYAAGGIPVLWLLDVPTRRFEVYADPQRDGRYRAVHVLGVDDEAVPPGTALRWKVGALFVAA
jgi:hypothetical protein